MDAEKLAQGSVSLSVPCRAEYVSLCRLLVGALGSRENLDEETIADLKMVVTEAFTYFLGALRENEADLGEQMAERLPSVQMDFLVGDELWTVLVCNPDRRCRLSGGEAGGQASERRLGLLIMEALVDSLEWEEDATKGPVLRLTRRVTSAATAR